MIGLVAQQQAVQLGFQTNVQRGKGLVHQQQVGLQHQRPCQRGAALHSARELVRVGGQCGAVQPQHLSHGVGAAAGLGPRHTLRAQA